MAKKINYSPWVGLLKTAKSSAILLVPFLVAVLASVPAQYAWVAGPVIYFAKNAYELKTGNKLL